MPRINYNRAAEPAIVIRTIPDRSGMIVGRLVWARKSGSSIEFNCFTGPMSDIHVDGNGFAYMTDDITFASKGNDGLLKIAEALENRAAKLRKLHETGEVPFENENIQKALTALTEAVEGDDSTIAASLELASIMASETVS